MLWRHGGSEGIASPFFTSAPLYPRESRPLCSLKRRLGWPQGRTGRCGEERNYLCRESNPDRPAHVPSLCLLSFPGPLYELWSFSWWNFLQSRGCVTTLNILALHGEFFSTFLPKAECGMPPHVGCPWPLIRYIVSYPPDVNLRSESIFKLYSA
jgi:hypothetical protein